MKISFINNCRIRVLGLTAIMLMVFFSEATAQTCVGTTISSPVPKQTCTVGGALVWDGASGGSIDASENVTFTIVGTFRLKRSMPCAPGGWIYSQYYTVAASPATPAAGEVNQQVSCGSAVLNYTGSASTTYWQTYDQGTDLTYPITRTVTSSGTYYARTRNAGGCWSAGRALTVSLPTLPVGGTLSGGTTGSHFGSISRTLTLSGYTGTVKEWRYTENGGGDVVVASTSSTLNVNFSSGAYTNRVYRVIVQANGCEASSTTQGVTLGSLPPASTTVCVGETTSHTITTQISCTSTSAAVFALGSGGSINNGTQSSFAVTWGTAGTFTLKRPFPNCDTEVPGETVTVLPQPATPAAGEVTQTAGCGSVTLNYTGSVTNTFWQTSAGGTDETYRTTRTVTATGTYYARIKDANGCWSVGRSIVVTTIPQPPVPGTLSGGTTGSHFGSVTRTLTLSGYTGTVKEWRYKENGGADVIVANTSSTLAASFSNATSTSRVYRTIVQANGCEATSNTQTIQLSSLPAPTRTACVGETTSHTITTQISCTSTSAAVFALGSGGSINNGTQSSFTVTWGTAGTFTLKRPFPNCDTEVPGETVTVLPQPATPAAGEVAQTAGCGIVTLNYTGSVTNTFWQTSAGGTDETYRTTRTVTAAGTYYARIKDVNGCWSVGRSIVVTTVPQPPVPGTLSGGTTGSHFGSVTRTLTLSGHTGTVKEWRYKENGGADVIVTSTSSTLVASFSSATSTSRVYRAIVQANGCEATSTTQAIQLSTLPASSITVCVGQTTNHSITTQISCTSTSAAVFALGSGGAINNGTQQSFTVTWGTAGTFTLKRPFPNCDTEVPGETVTVLSQPAMPGSGEVNQQAVCGSVTVNYTGSVYDTYWQTSAAGTDETYRSTRTVTSPGTYYARIKGSNGCWSVGRSVDVTTIPQVPVAGTLAPSSGTYTGGVNIILTLSGNNASVKEYQYTQNSGSPQVVANTSTSLPVNFTNATGSTITRVYWAVVQGSNGCLANSQTAQIVVQLMPAATMTACVGQTTTHFIMRQTSCVGNAATFSDGTPTGEPPGSGGYFNIAWTTPGIYTFMRTFPSPCNNTVASTDVVQVLPAALTTPPTPIIDPDCPVQLTYNGTVPPGEEWHWQRSNSNGTQLDNAARRTTESPGGYYLRARSINGCWGASGQTITIAPHELVKAPIPNVDYECVGDGVNVKVSTDDPADRWYATSSSTEPLSADNTLLTSRDPKTLYVERIAIQECPIRDPFPIDPNVICDSKLNSIKVTKPLTPTLVVSPSIDVLENITYFDGLGREIQQVAIKGSPLGKDVVTPIKYDLNGREAIKYLPFVPGTNDGHYHENTTGAVTEPYEISPHHTFFTNSNSQIARDEKPFSVTVFEPSPLNRVLKQGAPGVVWQPDNINNPGSLDHTIKKAYPLNIPDEVLQWKYSILSETISAKVDGVFQYYPPNQLLVDRTYDEHKMLTIEYTDKEGRVVLKRVQVKNQTPVDHENFASTYYIYDDYGSLVTVLPPEAVKVLTQN